MRRFGKVIAVIGLVALLSLGAAVAVSASGGRFSGACAGVQEDIAEILGVENVDALRDELQGGETTLANLAEEKGVDLQELKDEVRQTVEEGNLPGGMLKRLEEGHGGFLRGNHPDGCNHGENGKE